MLTSEQYISKSLKVVNLKLKSNTPSQDIVQYLGQPIKASFRKGGFKNGISGFTFIDPQNCEAKNKFKCHLVVYEKGLGIYFRNFGSNYLIIIQKEEIKSIAVLKNSDVIKPYAFSLFSLLKNLGLHYENASKYLMPAEIIEEYKANFQIRLEETYFNFELEKITTEELVSFFEFNMYKDILRINVLSPKYLNR